MLADPYPHASVLVVDNASTDESRRIVEEKYPSVQIIANRKNLGFAGGHNVGIRHALRAGAKFVALLNQDIVAQPLWLVHLMETAEDHPEIGIFAPLLYDYSGKELDPLCLRILNLNEEYRRARPAPDKMKLLYEVPAAFGAALLIRREVFLKVGLFDPLFFAYHEEGDFFQRAIYHGFRTTVVTTSRINHWHTSQHPDQISLRARYLVVRNRGLAMLKDPRRNFADNLKAHFSAWFRSLAESARSPSGWRRIPLLIAVECWLLAALPVILYKRHRERRGPCYLER
jgi:GT2 family glycosyltransferase